jgi:hypothetical protein
MTFDFSGGRRLLLAGSQHGGFWIAAGLVAVILLAILYRAERRLVSPRAGLFLLGLRLVAAFVLVAALFEPIAARVYRETLRGRVIVAADVSQSMETVDPGRTAEERKALARDLGLASLDGVTALSRREVVRRLVDRPDAPVARLASDHAVDVLTFARATAPASLGALAELLRSPVKVDDTSTRETDWQPALTEAARSSAAETPVLGLVLLTDGRQNVPEAVGAEAVVDRLAAKGVAVYPILIGSTIPPRDAAIASVRAPDVVYRGDVATIEATIKVDGVPGRDVAVTLDRPGGSPLKQIVRAPTERGAPRPVARFRIAMEEAGTAALAIAVGPIDGDVRPENDRRVVAIQVIDDKADVLLIDGEARWEFRYLRNALARDPHVSVKAVVVHPPISGGNAQPTYATAIPSARTPADRQPDPLGTFEAVVVGDVAPADLSPSDWARLEWFVAERGGTLILSPGPKTWSALMAHETIRKLLPVIGQETVAVEPSAVDPERPALAPGVALVPTTAAMDAVAWPMFALASESSQNASTWAALPRLPWVVAGRAKPGATVLATAGGGDSLAAIAAQPYGLGKVLWVGTDGTWRWRHRVGDAYHHRFWGQAVRWAASGKRSAGNRHVRFGPIRPRASDGEPARIQAQISEGIPGVGPDLLIAARIYRVDSATRRSTGEPISLVRLSPIAGRPRTYEGNAPALPAGTYAIRLDVPQLAAALGIDADREGQVIPEARVDVVARETSELVELTADREPLERLAAATGGRVLADHEVGQLAPLLRARTTSVTRSEETPIWDQPGALILFFGLLTVEWVTRKRLGLP